MFRNVGVLGTFQQEALQLKRESFYVIMYFFQIALEYIYIYNVTSSLAGFVQKIKFVFFF